MKTIKKTLCILLALCMILALSACGQQSSSTANSGKKSLRVALVVNQPFGDKGSMDDLAAGAERAAKDFGVEVAKLESSTEKFEDDVRAMAKEGYDLIVTTFFYMQDATIAVSKEYPDTMFCAVYQSINDETTKYDNIWDIEFHGEQAFYIAGYMAGMYTKSNVVGIQVGGDEPSPKAEANGFMEGVYAANPNARVEFAYAGGYGDPVTAKERALAMIANGCDFIQNDSGASNAGVVEACKEKGLLTAGEITDYWDTYEGFEGIIGIGFGNVAYDAIKALVDGKYPGGEHSIYGLAQGGYVMDWASYQRFADKNSDFADCIKAGKEIEEQIMSNKIIVDYNTADPNWDSILALH